MSSRGIRNNNPGNIRKSAVRFQGLAAAQPDSAFWTFSGPEWGLRAMAKILMTYEGRGVDTVREIISTWAPPNENNTGAYVEAVLKGLVAAEVVDAAGHPVTEDSLIDVRQAHIMAPLLKAIVAHENGSQPYADCTYAKALQLAGLKVPLVINDNQVAPGQAQRPAGFRS